MNPARRDLHFSTLDQVMPDVERLLLGYSSAGEWTLAQICRHLSTVLRRIVDLPASTPHDPTQWVDEESKRSVLQSGLLPEGLPAPSEILPPPHLNDLDEANALRAAIAHYQASPGPVIPHRIFGPLSRTEWDRLQCIHCAHHLSFAIPHQQPN